MEEEFFRVIFSRRSCREFLSDPLDQKTIEKLLEAMRRAPSAGNLQPWHFYVISSDRLKKELARAAYGQDFIAEAPLVIVICALPQRSASYYGERGRTLYCIQDTAAVVENLLLAAEALGLGACWVGAFDEREAVHLLGLPADRRPVAIVPVGRPSDHPRLTSRKPLSEIVTYL